LLASNSTAQPPLSFKETDDGLLKCWLARCGVVVSFTFPGARGCDCLEKPGNLLAGSICLSIEYQDRYVDSLEGFSRQTVHECTTNDGRHHFRIGSRDPSPDEVRRGEVSRNHFPLFQDFCSLLQPNPSSNRTRYRVWHRQRRRSTICSSRTFTRNGRIASLPSLDAPPFCVPATCVTLLSARPDDRSRPKLRTNAVIEIATLPNPLRSEVGPCIVISAVCLRLVMVLLSFD
jgi:hypothetical protein